MCSAARANRGGAQQGDRPARADQAVAPGRRAGCRGPSQGPGAARVSCKTHGTRALRPASQRERRIRFLGRGRARFSPTEFNPAPLRRFVFSRRKRDTLPLRACVLTVHADDRLPGIGVRHRAATSVPSPDFFDEVSFFQKLMRVWAIVMTGKCFLAGRSTAVSHQLVRRIGTRFTTITAAWRTGW